MNRRGVTLLELLTVVLIIALLAALLMPVLQGVRQRSYKTVCTSHLRQLSAAVVMYRNDYGELPPAQVLAFPYVKNWDIFVCPADPFAEVGGSTSIGRFFAHRLGYSEVSLSYAYVREDVQKPDHYRRLQSADPNHGVFVCALHDKCDWTGVTTEQARAGFVDAMIACVDGVLRARLDGSVEWKRVPLRGFVCPGDGAWTERRDGWRLMSDEPCPPDICNDEGC